MKEAEILKIEINVYATEDGFKVRNEINIKGSFIYALSELNKKERQELIKHFLKAISLNEEEIVKQLKKQIEEKIKLVKELDLNKLQKGDKNE